MSNRLKLNKRERIAVNVMKSIFSNKFIDNYLAEYGKYGLYHHIMAHLPSGHVLLGIAPKYNLITSKYKMRAKESRIFHSLIRSFFIANLSSTSKSHCTYKYYTVLTKLADGKPTNTVYKDKRTNKPVKTELNRIHRKFIQQVARANGKLSVTDFENPTKLSKAHHLYTEPHHHNLLLIPGNQRYQLQHQLQQDYKAVTGYKPVRANIKPLLYNHHQPNNFDENKKALKAYLFYLTKDDAIQTKDCTPELFKDDKHSQLNHKQRQLAFKCQLQTVKGTPTVTYSHLNSSDFSKSIARHQSQPSNIDHISNLKSQLKLSKITEKHQTGKPKQHTKHLITRLTAQITTNSTTKATSHNLVSQLERLPEWDGVDMLCGYRFARYYWTGLKATYHLNVAKLFNKPLLDEPLLITRSSKKDATPSVIIGTASGIPP